MTTAVLSLPEEASAVVGIATLHDQVCGSSWNFAGDSWLRSDVTAVPDLLSFRELRLLRYVARSDTKRYVSREQLQRNCQMFFTPKIPIIFL